MGKVESILKSEMVRLAKREVNKVTHSLIGELRSLKGILFQLRKAISNLERTPSLKVREGVRKTSLKAPAEEVQRFRFSPSLIRSLRKRLRITQKELALLTGVTVGAVHKWEVGKFKPTMKKREIMVALRKLGRRKVREMLETKVPKTIGKDISSLKSKQTKKASKK
ncbi:MAG: helix-turn-helix domain-containing protein [Thermodesulfobacteriota bacterium]